MRLLPHPDAAPGPVGQIDATVSRTDARIHLAFRLIGQLSEIAVPTPGLPARADELWRHTCFEAFVMAEQGYFEFNLAPSSAWAAYRFDGYRDGMRDVELLAPRVEWTASAGSAVLEATIQLPSDATGPLGLSAVVEALDGTRSYWALAHAPGKPDFHDPACFIGQLPPAP